MTAARKICIITGTRAEYGLLRPLMKILRADPDIELQIIATGAHLSIPHGHTIDEIIKDGFEVSQSVDMHLASDTPEAIGQALGVAVSGLTHSLTQLRPDMVVILGDRYEALAAAQSAMILGIPIAHIHGGEKTEGAMDEAIRHAITKMSHLHFVATQEFKTRVHQLGEAPDMVFNVGATGLDNIASLDVMPLDDLATFLGMSLDGPIFLITYHPVTLDHEGRDNISQLLGALEHFEDARLIFTGANADPNHQQINMAVQQFCAARPGKATSVTSLGTHRFLSLMHHAHVVVGNSSSGILEAPSIGTPTVNIGIRQQGRPRANSVYDCAEDAGQIHAALTTALSADAQALAAKRQTPYGQAGAGAKIASVLKSVDLQNILLKEFRDL